MKRYLKRFLIYTLLFVVALFLVVWGMSLLKCEYLTRKYYADFEFAYQNNTIIGDIEYFKVLRCDKSRAEVYYVSDNCGDVLTFAYRDGSWVETNWRTVWSKTGSASDSVWPYWWQHFITGF